MNIKRIHKVISDIEKENLYYTINERDAYYYESLYSLDYELNEDDVADYLAEEISYLLDLELVGSGNYRCVLRLNEATCLKISLDSDYTYMNGKEYKLLQYCKANNQELLKFLMPITARVNNINIMPIAIENNNRIPNRFKYYVEMLFIKNGIFLVDITKDSNWGFYKGHPVILDYAEWYKI